MCQPFHSKEERLEWWKDARFGMFIHWGPVSIKGTEIGWSRGREIPLEEYDALYKQFNPVKFDALEWVRIAKAAGMKCVAVTNTFSKDELNEADIVLDSLENFNMDILGDN